MKIKSVILLGPALLLASALFAQSPNASQSSSGVPTLAAAPAPMDDKEVLTELKKEGPAQLMKDLSSRGVNFEMDPEMEKKLRHAKATDEVVNAVKAAGPKEREAAIRASAMAAGQAVLSPDEAAAFKPLQTELDPDKAIAMAEAFVQKFPKSEALTYVYAFEGNAYETKGNAEKMVEYAEKSLALKNDNLMSLLMAAYGIPQPQYTKLHQADEEKQLNQAESYANEALKQVDTLKKQPNEDDKAFSDRKATYISNAHGDLGMIHLDRAQLGLMSLDKAELVKAENDFKQAVTIAPHPEPTDYYRMGEACKLQGHYDDAIAAFSKASDLGQGVLKQYADQQVVRLKQAKAQAGTAAKP
jgi:tetratricopeptide (TPR) repeat protein